MAKLPRQNRNKTKFELMFQDIKNCTNQTETDSTMNYLISHKADYITSRFTSEKSEDILLVLTLDILFEVKTKQDMSISHIAIYFWSSNYISLLILR